jgi:CheY-like chemotaxis protein
MNGSEARSLDPQNASMERNAMPPSNRGRILIVDDDVTNRQVFVILAKRLGFLADVAANGQEAVKMAVDQDYALILMDCHMPVMDGLTATKAIRALDKPVADVPIIAVTADATSNQRDLCLTAGMNDYVTKPVKPAVFGRIFEAWLPNPL